MLDIKGTAVLYFCAMDSPKRDESMVRAIDLAGGPAALARFITGFPGQAPITAQAICDWKKTPPKRVIAVEAATAEEEGGLPRVTRHELAPEIYPAPPVGGGTPEPARAG